MRQEDKDLLFKDLCARLPYGVKCKIGNYNYIICDISFERQYDIFYNSGRDFSIGVIGTEDNGNTFHTSVHEKHVKLYLFPLSSMTEEEKKEYKKIYELDTEILVNYPMNGEPFPALYNSQDWLNKKMFDYRGLIEKGLAIDASGLNIY